jgi:thymidylate synthase (FAD)
MVLPLSTMTQWYWSGSLGAFAKMCKLRMDTHSQHYTRYLAEDISFLLKSKFPVSWEALMNK